MSRDQNKFNTDERTEKIWSLLSLAARNRQTLTYGMVANLVGQVIAQGLGPYLGRITDYCSTNNLPCLARLVVSKETGRPSEDLPGTNEDVFAFGWIEYNEHIMKERLESNKGTVQIWSVLSLAARNRQTLTFGMVAKLTGIRPEEGMKAHLERIAAYCAGHDLPCLARLVVSKETGRPSEDLPGTNEDVFAVDWIEHDTPTPKDFR
jgi:alkylated DNA nucleotide flippase Atl1